MTLQPRQELLNMIFLSSWLESMTWTSWLIPRLSIWRAKRLSLSSVRVKLYNWKIKSSVSKMNSIIWRLLKRNTAMRMLIFKRELILSLKETLSLRPALKILNPRLDQRRTKSCIWEKNLKVQDIATLPFWITTQICKLKSILLTTILEWSQYRMKSWQRSLISSSKLMRLSEWD